MTPERKSVLMEAEQWARTLRARGYPDAEVAPEYCIGNEIGPDRFFTRIVSVYVGEFRPKEERPSLLRRIITRIRA